MQERISSDYPLVMGSQSPRRLELLKQIGIPVDVLVIEIDEAMMPGERPDAMATRLARQKGAQALYTFKQQGRQAAGRWFLCADTIVHVSGELLGKPRDDDDARRMLRLLSGRTHAVTTGFVIHGPDAFDAPAYAETTAVTFRTLSEQEVQRYARTREGFDKAGGYAIQGIAGAFVEKIDGSYANVVGLPIHRVVEVLQRLGALEHFPL
jgi:septum formation protein